MRALVFLMLLSEPILNDRGRLVWFIREAFC
jgi:hypothetical protein